MNLVPQRVPSVMLSDLLVAVVDKGFSPRDVRVGFKLPENFSLVDYKDLQGYCVSASKAMIGTDPDNKPVILLVAQPITEAEVESKDEVSRSE